MTYDDLSAMFGLICVVAATVIGILLFISPLIIIGRLGQIIELLKKLNQK